MRTRGGALLAAILVVLAGAAFVVRYAGEFLVRQDPLGDADVAIVLSGEPLLRTLAARDLYRDGRVRRIVIIPEMGPPPAVQRELDALHIRAAQPISVQILRASGVPESKFALLPDPIDGTIGEARQIRRLVDAPSSERVVVITSKFASRRACFIFERILARSITCWPSPYDPFQPRAWWQQPRNALNVVVEYQKLTANALTLLVTRAP